MRLYPRSVHLCSYLALTAAIFFAGSAQAQLLIHSQESNTRTGVALNAAVSFSEIEYDGDRGSEGDVERSIIGLGLTLPLSSIVELYGEFGYIAEADLQETRGDGDGFLVGGGLRGTLLRRDRLSLLGRGGFRFITEDYGSGLDADIGEVDLGLTARFAANRDLGLYGGLDFIPYSDGELDTGAGDVDFDRDKRIGLRFGADYKIQSVTLNGEFSLISEEALILRLTFPL